MGEVFRRRWELVYRWLMRAVGREPEAVPVCKSAPGSYAADDRMDMALWLRRNGLQ